MGETDKQVLDEVAITGLLSELTELYESHFRWVPPITRIGLESQQQLSPDSLEKFREKVAANKRYWKIYRVVDILVIHLLLVVYVSHAPISMMWAVSVIVIFWLCFFSLNYYYHHLKPKVQKRLESSKLSEQLLLEPDIAKPLVGYVPKMFRVFLARDSKSIASKAITHVAFNLDWFLEPRKGLFRWEWFIRLILSPVIQILITVGFYHGLNHDLECLWTVLFLFSIFMIIECLATFASRRSEMFLELLIEKCYSMHEREANGNTE